MIKTALEQHLGAHRVREIQNPLHPEQKLLMLYLELNVPVTVLMTNGLSDYTMPVSEKWVGREHNELFFTMGTYWDLDDHANPNLNWVYEWLFRLETFVREKQTWFGPGHTIPAGNPPVRISPLMKQDHFIFADPIFTEDLLKPLKSDGKEVHFLATIPIFEDELDYKNVKGTLKFLKKFVNQKNDERLDDYRLSVQKSRFRLYR